MDDIIQQGISAFNSGDYDTARKLLIDAVKNYPDNERAWGWMYSVCNTDKGRIHCLRQILRINPKNEKASQLIYKFTNNDSPLENSHSSAPIVQTKLINKPKSLKKIAFAATIIIFGIASVILAVVLSSGFFSSVNSPCNDEVLRKTLNISLTQNQNMRIRDYGIFPLKNPKEGTLVWRIYERSSYGCVVESSAEVNGERIVATVWFVDLQQKKVYPDDPNANAIIKGIYMATGDQNLIHGIPFP